MGNSHAHLNSHAQQSLTSQQQQKQLKIQKEQELQQAQQLQALVASLPHILEPHILEQVKNLSPQDQIQVLSQLTLRNTALTLQQQTQSLQQQQQQQSNNVHSNFLQNP